MDGWMKEHCFFIVQMTIKWFDSVGGNQNTQSESTHRGEHANLTQKGPELAHLGIEPRTFLLVRKQCHSHSHHAAILRM